MEKKIVVSFGGGVQSTAIALMVLKGELPRPDLWLFADTGDEPEAVYPHVKKWREKIEAAGMEFVTVHRFEDKQSLSEHCLVGLRERKGSATYLPPLFLEMKDELERTPLHRQCTAEFKIKPLHRYMKTWAEVPRAYKGSPLVTQWLGISYDEIQRSRISQERWYEFEYPLIDRRIRRSDCLKMLADAGESAPRSACVFCPFHSDDEWRRLRKTPGDWNNAVEFERELHRNYAAGNCGKMNSQPTLHRSGRPLEEIDFTDRQESLFGDLSEECWGVCGV